MNFIDSTGTKIKDGNTIELLEGMQAALKGTQYRAEIYKWDEADQDESTVAVGSFMNIKLDAERAKKFKIV